MLAELKRSKAEKKMENLNLRLENAHVRRLNLLLSRRPSTAAEDANSGLNVTIPSPTKLEFETTEFHTTPLPPHVKARFESSLASPKKAATKDETQRRMLAANARALSNLLKRYVMSIGMRGVFHLIGFMSLFCVGARRVDSIRFDSIGLTATPTLPRP